MGSSAGKGKEPKIAGNAFDPNDIIYSNDNCYRWDAKSPNRTLHRWKRFKGHSGAKEIAILELKKRIALIGVDYNSVEWVTQNSYYYYLRDVFLRNGINPEAEGGEFRHSLTNSIVDWCKELGTTREDLKIYASSRAVLYHKGKKFDVSLRNINELVGKGTDVIIIEKEDVSEVLHSSTDELGIALLDTKGFVVRYANKLSKLAKEDGAHIAMITDLDDAGLLMAVAVKRKIPSLYRIGINFDIIKQLEIKREDVEESYTGGGATKTLHNSIEVPTDIATKEELTYVRTRRVEIDSVINNVGHEKFADIVIKKLVAKFPQRDYNRSTEVPDYAYPSVIHQLASIARKNTTALLVDNVEWLEGCLAKFEGVKNITKMEKDIKANFTSLVDNTNNLDLIELFGKIQTLIDDYDYLNYELVEGTQEEGVAP